MPHAAKELTLIREWVKDARADLAFIREWVRENKAPDAGSAAQMPAPTVTTQVPAPAPLAPIAITGVAGFFPGCPDVAAFWRALDRDESLLSPIPAKRFGALAGWGGFVPDVASFDPSLFNILPLEAEEMDPRVRLLLMSTWRTLEDARVDPRTLKKSNTGVFIACEGNEYAVLMNRAGFTPKLGFGQANGMVANRISYHFDLAGPSEMVDATCAGFAVALHRAVVALRAGLIDRAIVGAANLILLPDPFQFLGEAGQLSARDTVKSFGRDGDGFLRAEGVGTILIERRADALAAGRDIYAEIKHTAVNFNGQGGVSMASPNTEAHAALIRACYREAAIDPRDVSYVEAQGMGSPVADIAEWTALNRALRDLCDERGLRADPGFCRVSTLKPMLGHMHSASSLGALLKVVRSFQTGRIHKVLGFTEPNEHCDMHGTPCRIASETELWSSRDGKPRLAAIHAFGSSGNNAHVLLEEARENRRAANDVFAPPAGRPFEARPYWFSTVKTNEPAAAVTASPPTTEPQAAAFDAELGFIRGLLGVDAKGFDKELPFTELGLDSLLVGPFVERIESEFGVSLRKSDVFSHATPVRLARHVALLRGAARSDFSAASAGPWVPESGTDDIAIIGMSLQVAGAETAEAFWNLLREGRSGIAPLPVERGGGESAGDASTLKVTHGGWMSDVDAFDPLFFKISPKESAAMDPRHRKLLQAAWAAIEDSGHSPDEWKGAEHGIFIGIEESDYPYDERSPITAVHGGTAPARIGYFLDTKGPVLAISTACSSSLVAVHYACRSILSGESDCALAGGCNLISQPERSLYALSQMGDMLSPDGKCYAFDRRANGMVLGEGVGLVVLKRLSHALRDGDPIHAVIKGSGVNYDGKTNGLTAPNGARQRELYERVQRRSGVAPEKISYVVAHGTGTSLGDPVECNALIDAFGTGARKTSEPWCALTSPKTNIGHTQAASGIVNLITAALALKHGEIPPSLNYEQTNEDIALAGSPLFVNSALRSWPGSNRHAAVSSFGHTGTNAHLVLGCAPTAPTAPTAAGDGAQASPCMIVLSAKSEERLRETARNLIEHTIDNLADLAYTLQVGRAPMDERLGFVAETVDELRAKLRAFLAGQGESAGIYRGQAKREDAVLSLFSTDAELRKALGDWMERGKFDQVLKLWVHGLAVDWARFHGKAQRRRVHLPTYPFEKERYWLKPSGVPTERVHETADEMPVLTFSEAWAPAASPVASATIPRTLVGIVAEPGMESAWREALRRVAPATEWLFVTAQSPAGWEAALRSVGAKRASIDALVYLPPLSAPEAAGVVRDPALVLPLLQALAAVQLTAGRLILVCPFHDELERCHADAWIAYGRSLRSVFPEMNTNVVAVGLSADDAEAALTDCVETIWTEACDGGDAGGVLYDRGRRHVLRIEPPPTTFSGRANPFRQGGVYLITGGLGGLGLLCAEHLAKNYGARLVLVGRSEPGPAQLPRIGALKKGGAELLCLRADVGDEVSLRAAVAEAKARFGVIHGVIHAAGIASERGVLEKEAADFRATLRPKIEGTLALDEALRDEPLDFVVYFSSSAAVLGDFGACDYAVGNRFQNAFASYRNALRARGERHGRTVAIDWPAWEQGGMGAADKEQARFYLRTSGQRALAAAEGLALLENLLAQDAAQHLVLAGKPDRVRRFLGLAEESRAAAAGKADMQADRAPAAVGSDLEECVQADLREIIGALLEIDRAKLKLDANLADFGFDSISLAELAKRLGARFDLKLTPALFFGYSTIGRLARYLLDEHGASVRLRYAEPATTEAADGAPSSRAASVGEVLAAPDGADRHGGDMRPARDEPIAIIGMSGRFPQARNIDEMWRILAEGRDAVTEIPPERFDWREFFGDPARDKKKSNGKWMGCLPGVAEFDPLFFEISPREAETMDPRQRHLLQESWKALENAGYGPRQIACHKIGVFVGVEEGDYAFLAPEGELTSNHNAILASRLAYLLDFHGPAMAINTACSSGLVAAHQACASLRNGECDTALVAAVSLQLTPAGHIAMGQAGMLSPDGKCFVFDKRANGMVPGEAAVALVLKRLSQAEADGDPIHAVIRASGVNYDGKTNGITAPNGVAQAELLGEVYTKARIDPGEVEYVVAHGTGTRLGDPVEVNALHRAFSAATKRRACCALTSTKSNFGHTFAASGLVGALGLVQALRHGTIPPSLHCEQENDYIDWDKSAFCVNKRAKAWPVRAGRKRLGAVSAFGMSGTNAHMVIEEYAPAGRAADAPAAPAFVLALSAKTEEALREQIDALAEALRRPETRAASLASISYTLLEGRHVFAHRVAWLARDIEEALQGLEALRRGETTPALAIWRGRATQENGGPKALRRKVDTLLERARDRFGELEAYRETLGALAELHCQGADVSWHSLFVGATPRRVALPTYPFARETYWVEKREPIAGGGSSGAGRLHPLVHANTSRFGFQQFTSLFNGTEPVLTHHVVRGERVLPGVAYLEMARAALVSSLPSETAGDAVVLSNVVWPSAFVVGDAARTLRLGLGETTGDSRGLPIAFEAYSENEGAGATTHAKGKVARTGFGAGETASLDLEALRRRMTRGRLDAETCYAAFSSAGVDYGAMYRCVDHLLAGDGEALARIVLPAAAGTRAGDYVLHPGLLDSAFQATLGLELSAKAGSPPRIPFALEEILVVAALPASGWVWARRSPGREGAGDAVTAYDLDFADDTGRVCVRLRGLCLRALSAPVRRNAPLEFPRVLSGDEFYLRDHGGLLPGVVSLEWARAAGRLAFGRPVRGLKNVVWKRPLTAEDASGEIRTTLTQAGAGFAYHVRVGEWIHAQGMLVGDTASDAGSGSIPLQEIRTRCVSVLPENEHETRIGARLGPSMRSIAEFRHDGPNEAFATLRLPACVAATADEFILHPSLLNGALQVCTLLARIEDPLGDAPTPFGIDEMWIHGAIPAEACVHARRRSDARSSSRGSGLCRYDLVVTDRDGVVAVSIKGYSAISARKHVNVDAGAGSGDAEGTVFAVPCWREASPSVHSRSEPVAPVFVLTEATSGLQAALRKAWPEARVELLPANGVECAEAAMAGFERVHRLLQDGLNEERKERRAVLVLASAEADDVWAGTCSGLFRTARMEHSRVEAKVLRVSREVLAKADEVLDCVKLELGQAADEIDVRWDGKGVRALRSIREQSMPDALPVASLRKGAAVWITGGLGGIGRAFARHYALELGARVFLSGRSPLDDEKRAFLQDLRARGGDVRYLQGDIASSGEVERMLETILAAGGRLGGVIHGAGVIEDAYIREKRPDAIARVWRPKVAGALAIDAATSGLELDFLVLFSSLTGSFGNAGQSDYAGANAFLDGFAERRNRLVSEGRRQGRTVSIAWPLWRSGGMGMNAQNEIMLKQRSGMTPMETDVGIAAFDRSLVSGSAHVLVLHGDPTAIRTKLLGAGERAAEAEQGKRGENVSGEALERLQAELRRVIAEQQKIVPERIELDAELPQYGFDSIRLTEFANRLNEAFGLDLMPTLFFEHTTVRAIARHLFEKHADKFSEKWRGKVQAARTGKADAASNVARVEPIERACEERSLCAPAEPQPIAIVGMAGRFPGSENVDEFWRHIVANHDLVSEVPADRWDWRALYGDPLEESGKTKVKSAGFMEGVARFDPAFFGISPREAISMDPQFRLLLETVWATIEDAGYRASDLAGTKTGVFVGISTSDYKEAWLRQVEPGATDGPALVSHFVVANRISYALDLRGPSEPIDTACSSSLIAIHRAIEAMRQGGCDQAIVGGVNVICTPDIMIGASRAGMLSEDGRCKTFDAGADGYGRGEGVGALLLKPLDAALRDGDHVYALVRGSAENHGGRAQSPTAPNPASQRDLLVSAYTRAGVDPRTVGYIEAHGTGTSLGDPIEIDGLRGAFEVLYQQAGATVTVPHCGLGSVKTNIGHLEAAAGIAGVLKVVMMLRHGKIPGNIHLRTPNPYLRLAGTPFFLADETRDWPALRDERGGTLPRRAGVSSFGIGGSNAHVILEEFAPPARVSEPQTRTGQAAQLARLIVLSAKTAERLEELARRLRDFVANAPDERGLTLDELAYTLQTGREALEERLGFVAASLPEVVVKLDAFLKRREGGAGLHRGQLARGETAFAVVGSAPAASDEGGLLAHWARGGEVDWRARWRGPTPRRASLPTYPFARNRYWFAVGKEERVPRLPAFAHAPAPAPAPASAKREETPLPTIAAGPSLAEIEAFLVGSLTKILYLEENAVERDSSFIDMGLDSVLAVEWIQSIKVKYGLKVPATKVYDYPTVTALRDYLMQALGARSDGEATIMPTRVPAAVFSLDEILEQVSKKHLSVEEAEQLIDELGLENIGEHEESQS